MSCPETISRAYIRDQTSNQFRPSGLKAQPRLRDYAKTFAGGAFWFVSLLTVVIAIGSLS